MWAKNSRSLNDNLSWNVNCLWNYLSIIISTDLALTLNNRFGKGIY